LNYLNTPPTGLAIFSTVLGFNPPGDGMREALDPRSRSKEIILHKKLGAEYSTLKFEFLRRPSRELSIFPSTKFDDLVRSRESRHSCEACPGESREQESKNT
jgi:hypothetical protein